MAFIAAAVSGSLVSLQEDRLEAGGAAVDAQQVDPVADQRARHLGAQVGRALQRQQRHAVRLAHDGALADAGDGPGRLDGAGRGAGDLDLDRAAAAQLRRQLLLGPLGDDLAVLDDQQAVAGLADLGQDVAGEQDGVLAAQRLDGRAHLDDLHRVEPAGRLVEDQQLRLVHQRLGHADALPVAVRQAGDELVVDLARRGLLLGLGHRARAASLPATPRSSAAKVR